MSLREKYAEALEKYVENPQEDRLMEAYELGRAALEEGASLLELATAHNEAFCRGHHDTKEMSRAMQFLSEALAPFEMAYLGYRDANLDLQRAIKSAEERNAELRRANEAAEAAKRDLESFSYSVSHDLRAPLRAIDGFSQAIREDCGDTMTPEAMALLERVRGAAQRMGHLIDDLLALSRVSRAPLAVTRLDVSELARSVAAGLLQGAPHRKVDFDIQAGIVVRGDSGLMRIVLENLLGNAWKFTSKKPEAHIQVGAVEGGFFVKDDGAGFDMGAHARLFGAFQRLHTNAEFEGSGIGLATVQRIVVRHGGNLTGVGEPGQGATFTVFLPG
jgi:signal transduction histidine kinase